MATIITLFTTIFSCSFVTYFTFSYLNKQFTYVNLFHTTGLFLYILETSENQRERERKG